MAKTTLLSLGHMKTASGTALDSLTNGHSATDTAHVLDQDK